MLSLLAHYDPVLLGLFAGLVIGFPLGAVWGRDRERIRTAKERTAIRARMTELDEMMGRRV